MQRCIKLSPKGVRPRAGVCNIYPSSLQLMQPAGRFAEKSIREAWCVERRLEILLLFSEGEEKQDIEAGVADVSKRSYVTFPHTH